MDCRECERLIPAFISDSLGYKQLNAFMEHVETCPDCKEELTIQILITEGMARLEEGGAFDLQEEIGKRMKSALKRIKIHKIFRKVRISLELCALLAVIVMACFLLL